MRVALRLVILAVLLAVAFVPSRTSRADDSACTDGCYNAQQSCIMDCNSGPHPPSCATDCATKFNACINKCNNPAGEGGPDN
jgi:uncharacterized membrane protein